MEKVTHARGNISGLSILLAEEFSEMGYGIRCPFGGLQVDVLLYLQNVDVRFSLAIDASKEKWKLLGICSVEIGLALWEILSGAFGPWLTHGKLDFGGDLETIRVKRQVMDQGSSC